MGVIFMDKDPTLQDVRVGVVDLAVETWDQAQVYPSAGIKETQEYPVVEIKSRAQA